MSLTLGKITLTSPDDERSRRIVVAPILITVRLQRQLTFAPQVVSRSSQPRLVFAPDVVQRSEPTPAPAPAPRSPGLPELPTRAAVHEILAESRPDAQRCFERGMVPGPVTLRLQVRGTDGRVERAIATPHTSTAECVEQKAERLRFPRFSRRQISIVHRYVFR